MTPRHNPIVQQTVASLLVAALGGYPVRVLADQGVPVQSVPPPPGYVLPPQAPQSQPPQGYAPPAQGAPQSYAAPPAPAPQAPAYAPQQQPPPQAYAPPQAAPQQPAQQAPPAYAPQQQPPPQTYAPPQAAPQGYAQQPAQAPPAYAPPPPAYAPPATAGAAAGAAAAPGAPQGYAQQPAQAPPAYAPPPPAYAPPAAAGTAAGAAAAPGAPQGYAQQPAQAPPAYALPPPAYAPPAAAGAAAGAAAAQSQLPAVQEVPGTGPRLPPGAVPVPQAATPSPSPARTGEADLGSAPPPPPPPGYAPTAPTSQKAAPVDDRLIRLEWRPAHVEGSRGWGPMVQVPIMGPDKRPLQGRSLYTALGRNDLAEEYERRAAAKRIMGAGSALLLISGVAVGISALAIHGCNPGDVKCWDDRDSQLRSRFYWSGGLVLGGAVLGIGASAYSPHPVGRDELVGLIREHNQKIRSEPGVRLGALAVPGGGGLSLAGNF